jgi:type IV pilus assembly protein PilF
MSKIVMCLLLISCSFLQSCQSNDEYNEAPKNQPDLSKAASYNVQLGLGYLKQGDRPRAKKKLLTALDQEPHSPDINAAMAYYLEQTNELDDAKKYYLKAISLSGNSGAQFNNYGTFLCKQGDYSKAETYFLKAVKDPQYIHTAGAYENAGLCVLAIPDTEKAKLYFNKALSQDPSRRESLYELVKLASKEGHDEHAFQLLQQHPDLVLDDRIFLDLAKNIAKKAGQFEVAAEYENSLAKLETKIDNSSGVNNEYNSSNG